MRHGKPAQKRSLVTLALLGKAVIPNVDFENPDATALCLETDFFGASRDRGNPFPGPFEATASEAIKVGPGHDG